MSRSTVVTARTRGIGGAISHRFAAAAAAVQQGRIDVLVNKVSG